jgi:hypothetical protein
MQYGEHWKFLQTSNDFSAERLPNKDLVVDDFRRGLHSHTGLVQTLF